MAITAHDEDIEREQRIDAHRRTLTKATTPSMRRMALNALQREIQARSPQAVAAMELARGLG